MADPRSLHLPFQPPLEPMLAKAAPALPEGDDWLFEPKWDGFRALVWRADGDLLIQSRDLRPLGRYFPELEVALRAALPTRCVLDGEIVIATGGRLDFEALLGRIHPAASRVQLLAAQTPSSYVAWDLLALGEDDLRAAPQRERRARLEAALAGVRPPVHVTPATLDRGVAGDWFSRFEGAGLDGVIAKPASLAYAPGKRAMLKIKHQRTADVIVAGFRWYKGGRGRLVGSLLLGLYDASGTLHHVGVCASFKQAERAALAERLAPLTEGAREHHPWRGWAELEDATASAAPSAEPGEAAPAQRTPGGTSRWNRGKDLSWEPLRLELVIEVAYDHMQGSRFRHATHLVRWRPDRATTSCRYDQLEATPPEEIGKIFSAR